MSKLNIFTNLKDKLFRVPLTMLGKAGKIAPEPLVPAPDPTPAPKPVRPKVEDK